MTLTDQRQLECEEAAKTIADAKSLIGLSVGDLADMWDIHPRTVLRYTKGDTPPKLSVRKSLDEIRELAHYLREVFPREKAATNWLYTPEELLQGRRPIDLVIQRETAHVIHVLAGIQSGAFS